MPIEDELSNKGEMMTKIKPILVHKTISYIRPDLVSEEVKELVERLNKEGYLKIKVIVHDPEPGNAKASSVYATTVIATLRTNIDIGFNSPT